MSTQEEKASIGIQISSACEMKNEDYGEARKHGDQSDPPLHLRNRELTSLWRATKSASYLEGVLTERSRNPSAGYKQCEADYLAKAKEGFEKYYEEAPRFKYSFEAAERAWHSAKLSMLARVKQLEAREKKLVAALELIAGEGFLAKSNSPEFNIGVADRLVETARQALKEDV